MMTARNPPAEPAFPLDDPAPARGGARLAARRAAFLAAARAAFEEKGFAATTIEDVISRSGGSRQTLYALFGDKQGLFEALVTEICETMLVGMAPQDLELLPLEEALAFFSERYLAAVTSPKALALRRLLIAESARIPALAERYWARGPARTHAFLSAFMERRRAGGELAVGDAGAAAAHFLDMLAGGVRQQCLIGLRPPPGPEERRALARAAIALFLNGAAPRPA
ncbi:TetR/AcrR family transcriptional regulator [Methylocella sp.]|uniref:TetR/AcrR family transcriptional regulator n=1 Tax=Methylocella sp. TaxID=1978226 RepID=UPI0037841498